MTPPRYGVYKHVVMVVGPLHILLARLAGTLVAPPAVTLADCVKLAEAVVQIIDSQQVVVVGIRILYAAWV